MTVKKLKTKLEEFPDDYTIDLFCDKNTEGISVSNPRGVTTIEEVIEIP